MTIHSLLTTASALNLVNMARLDISIASFVVALPACLVLNRRLLASEAAVRPFKWGYYIIVSTMVSGVGNITIMLRSYSYSGDFAWLEIIYYLVLVVLCCWAFKRDRRAFLIMTVCTLSPFVWVANGVYVKRRWKEEVPRSVAPD